jgi:hypothetical protein
MNNEDLNQIRMVVREEIEGVETGLREEMKATEVRSQEFARDIETHLLKEMHRGFDRMDQRFDSFERRLYVPNPSPMPRGSTRPPPQPSPPSNRPSTTYTAR